LTKTSCSEKTDFEIGLCLSTQQYKNRMRKKTAMQLARKKLVVEETVALFHCS
jgi:hypothetical protein